ncbi:MAG: HAMP domain-containing histidine kinase [Gammaproteobacteria bacterium]|nr:HAMP domain-containing histidine kinase [Gammaproteobacteria bacterium]MBU1602587.1 HAMP domain-containing histidine kinase [Gammaproteobacteria bacterium]MBU2433392.1 HAMP domain-containing histidine kinase [Gammaproteobacteria bacterium]MBU2451308.1 HAMP domain-containing histidine kinase [Gammaproteobacteria bacterium]
MNNQPYDSLRRKLVLPFVLLGFSVSALLSLVTFGLVAELEEHAVVRILHVEMENFRGRKARNPAALSPATSVLTGDFLPVAEFPLVTPVKPGKDQIERFLKDNREYSVLITHVDDRPYALFYDRSHISSNLGGLALFLLVGTALMSLLSFLVGNHLARKVVRPIGRLLGEISEKTANARALPRSLQSFAVADYPPDEIGHLVRALDGFALRLHGFLERESCFASDVSHELRTPVAVIRGAAEVLVEHPNLPEAIRPRLLTIHRQALRMGQTLEAMLLLAREDRENGDPACAMAEIIDEAIADASPALAGRPVNIVFEASERPILPVERSLAYVLVSNLLRNACAYTRQGTITARLDGQGLEIADTGIGIAEERFPSLFERHAKGEESSGHGLGLSIVARIAQQLDWKIDIQSRSGEGTRVSIHFAQASPGAGE